MAVKIIRWIFGLVLFAFTAHGQVFNRTNDVLSLSPTANPMNWQQGSSVRLNVYLRQGSTAVNLSGVFCSWVVTDLRDDAVIASNVMTTTSTTNGAVTAQITPLAWDTGNYYRSTINVYSDAGVFQYTAALDNVAIVPVSAAIEFGITSDAAYRGDWGNYVSNKASTALQPSASITSLTGYGSAALYNVAGTNSLNEGQILIRAQTDVSANPIGLIGYIQDNGNSNEYRWLEFGPDYIGPWLGSYDQGATSIALNEFITNVSYDVGTRTFTIQGSGGGGMSVTVTNVMTNYTPVIGDFVLADTSANPITITMPSATNNMGKQISCRIMSSSNLLTIAPVAGDTINGESSIGLSIAGNAVDMISDGFTNWWVK